MSHAKDTAAKLAVADLVDKLGRRARAAEIAVGKLEALVAHHEETIGKLADVAKAARDAAEWMRAELLRLARSMGPTGGWVAPVLRIAAGPPADAMAVGRRLPACVEAWPECHSGGYDPRCCRFPKSCSCLSFAAGPTAEEAT